MRWVLSLVAKHDLNSLLIAENICVAWDKKPFQGGNSSSSGRDRQTSTFSPLTPVVPFPTRLLSHLICWIYFVSREVWLVEIPAACVQIVWAHDSIIWCSVTQCMHIILEQWYCYWLSRRNVPVTLRGSVTGPYSKPSSTIWQALESKGKHRCQHKKKKVWPFMNNLWTTSLVH